MKRKQQGLVRKAPSSGGELYSTYSPNPLPPVPSVESAAILEWLGKANFAVGELNGVLESVQDPSVINYMYVRKEAVLSSQIEGTQSTLDDLLRYESGGSAGIPLDDVQEVSSYVAALNHGVKRIREDGFPLSLRLIREIHRILLSNSRGREKTPGEFRTSQNWIGGTRPSTARFVPAPPDKVQELMGDLESFMHATEDGIPLLVKAALLHQQFETIHPFLDGNGRAGRLLITLFLCERNFLRSPFLYLSLFFKRHRDLYYEKLMEIRRTGDWEDWINFFLEGVAATATDAKDTLMGITRLFLCDDAKVAELGRTRVSASVVLNRFKQKPLLTVAELTERTGLSKPTAITILGRLTELGIIRPIDERKWGRIYVYSGYVDLLSPEE